MKKLFMSSGFEKNAQNLLALDIMISEPGTMVCTAIRYTTRALFVCVPGLGTINKVMQDRTAWSCPISTHCCLSQHSSDRSLIENICVLSSYSRAFGDGPRNFEQQLGDDDDDTCAGTPLF
ncbi:hypothetical protein TNCV_1242411 [Trichonephila clavipes]|nr:hypothetical protein TNCV_1242411 [Trichonephila clavipes]